MSDRYDRNTMPPWDISRPQKIVLDWLNQGEIKGTVLDVGCGTGENALKIAEAGFDVHGIDSSPKAILEAMDKAKEKGIKSASFEVLKVQDLEKHPDKFDTIVDVGLIHNFEEEVKKRMINMFSSAMNIGGSYLVVGFNENEPFGIGPPNRLRKNEIKRIFGEDWEVEYIKETEFESNLEKGSHPAYAVKAKKIK